MLRSWWLWPLLSLTLAQAHIRRVAVLGSSISMLVRPAGAGQPYPRILEQILNSRRDEIWLVQNLSDIAATVADVAVVARQLVAERPDYVVLQFGHVEAVLRPASRRAWQRAFLRSPGLSHQAQRRRRVWAWYSEARRRIGLRQQWIDAGTFERLLNGLVAYLQEEAGSSVILVEAPPGDDRLERYGKGSLAEISRFNKLIDAVARDRDAVLVRMEELTAGTELANIVTDGTHLSAAGHTRLGELIAERILAR